MPPYEFTCLACQQRFDVTMSYTEYGSRPVNCTHCGSRNVRRRMTRVRIAKSEESRMDSMMDESALEGMENNPQALGRMMKKMGKEMGEDVPPEFDDVVDRLEAGQSPEDIEAAMPGLGADTPDVDDDL